MKLSKVYCLVCAVLSAFGMLSWNVFISANSPRIQYIFLYQEKTNRKITGWSDPYNYKSQVDEVNKDFPYQARHDDIYKCDKNTLYLNSFTDDPEWKPEQECNDI